MGPDRGGAAIRVLDQAKDQPVYIVHSTFGGARVRRALLERRLCPARVSWTVLNSVISNNRAIGHGANPPRPGYPAGSGGGIYNDGKSVQAGCQGTRMKHNHAREVAARSSSSATT
jgi:hypothetical protein